MPKTFVISDTHFNHANIIKYCDRPFSSVDEMNAAIVYNWNSVVSPDDTVIHLGDFILGSCDNVLDILYTLNGHIILCQGNHDTAAKLTIYGENPDKITVTPLYYTSHKGRFFICSHFPPTSEGFIKMVTQNNAEVVCLHGHVHNNVPFVSGENSFNCSADVINFTPIQLSDIHLRR